MFETHLNARETRVDWPMWLAILGLMLVGTVFIYSATSIHETKTLWQRFQDGTDPVPEA